MRSCGTYLLVITSNEFFTKQSLARLTTFEKKIEEERKKENKKKVPSNMLALTAPTGKLGGAVLNAILEHNLLDPKDLVICVRLN